MASSYGHLFYGQKVVGKYTSPLAENDHPEPDPTEFVEDDGVQKYQSMIGLLQWLVSIARTVGYNDISHDFIA